MPNDHKRYQIKIMKNGPYIVTGGVTLKEKIIMPRGKGYEFIPGRELPQAEVYSLCRCGRSKNSPFCDGSHDKSHFSGLETASKAKYENRASLFDGPDLDLLDDNRCAFARFCHREEGNVWELTYHSDDPDLRPEAIRAASDCPAGRLVAMDKEGNILEPSLEPSIDIIQDPENDVSSGIFVKGGIPIESSDGAMYETRNRVMLCRCGKSRNKPFCDATHVSIQFSDEK